MLQCDVDNELACFSLDDNRLLYPFANNDEFFSAFNEAIRFMSELFFGSGRG